MSQNENKLTWNQCCFAVCKAAADGGNKGNMAYAAGYASAGRARGGMEGEERRVQALYILNNITHWRGDLAKTVRARLKEFSK